MYRLNFIIKDLQYSDTNIVGVGGHVCCRSLMQSFEDTFLELLTVENPNITFGILTLSITVPETEVFPVWAEKLQNCHLNFHAIYRSSREISISGIGSLYNLYFVTTRDVSQQMSI